MERKKITHNDNDEPTTHCTNRFQLLVIPIMTNDENVATCRFLSATCESDRTEEKEKHTQISSLLQ